MGLDMSLYGEKLAMTFGDNKEMVDGFPLHKTVVELAYWRKHPNLHGFIVEEFADGEDECQQIDLSIDDLKKIILAVKNDELPFTEGFFFGRSPQKGEPEYEETKQHDIQVFEKAIEWAEGQTENEWRNVCYRSSW